MCQAIFSQDVKIENQGKPSSEWKELPYLCCQAAGGEYSWAEHVCMAWFLFHNAARLMDNVEDNDPSNRHLPADLSLSAATGLFFTAQYALYKLSQQPDTKHAANDISQRFISELMKMGEGQHQDIIQKSPNLTQYWQIAERKSGSFFSLAAYCGARLATKDQRKLKGYEQYGFQLGLLIQLLDDLEDIYLWMNSPSQKAKLTACLPFVYTLEVVPEIEKTKIKEYLADSPTGYIEKDEMVSLLNQNGAVLYLFSEIERHSNLALAGLEKAEALSPASEKLQQIILELSHSQ